MKVLFYAAVAILAAHGLIHLLGFVAYWPLASIAELPYRTTLLGRDVGGVGMKVYALFWLIATVGFLISTFGMAVNKGWWPTAMLVTVVVSTLAILLDWAPSFRGAIVNGVVFGAMVLFYFLRSGTLHR